MLGKDARSRIGRRLAAGATVAVVAAAGVAAGPAHAGQQPKADPYIEIHDRTTNVGQPTHLVVTYGNRGGRALEYISYRCWKVKDDGSLKRLKMNVETYRSPLMPGQSANFELIADAKKVGKTKVQCSIIGFESQSGKERVALSEVATIRVNP
jgi:hypothetical protein